MDVSLADVVKAGIARRFSDLFIATPARVESYDSVKQKAVVQPLIKRSVPNETDDGAMALPDVINDVPVVFPGAGGYSFTFPVAKGDIVLLVFADQSLDVWLSSGKEVDPKDDRRCDVNDAIAIPGLRSFANPVSNPPSDAACVTVPGGKELRLGGSSATGAGKSVVVQSAINDFMDALDLAIPGAGTAAPALTALKAQLNLLNGGLGWKAGTDKAKAV